MPPTIRDLRTLAKRTIQKRAAQRPYGVLGRITETGSISVSGLPPGYSYCRLWTSAPFANIPATVVFNTKVANTPGAHVELEPTNENPPRYRVVGLNDPIAVPALGSQVNNAAVPDQDGRTLNQVVRGDTFLPGRVKRKRNSDGSQAGLFVTIEAFAAGGVDFPTQDFELIPTATASMKSWVALYGDVNDGLIHQLTLDDHALADFLTRANIFTEATWPVGAVKLWAYGLENGQTALTPTTQNEDIREFLNDSATGGHAILVDNVAQTQRAGLNFLPQPWLVTEATDDAGNNETEVACRLDPTGVSAPPDVDAANDRIPYYHAGTDTITAIAPKDLPTAYSAADVSNPPTPAQLNAAFGTPAAVGAGFVGIVNDGGAGTNEYICWSDDTNWFYIAGTKAT